MSKLFRNRVCVCMWQYVRSCQFDLKSQNENVHQKHPEFEYYTI